MKKILAVVGGQYGSEGKGACVAEIANKYNTHVRVGAPNAGHSVVFNGKVFKMQTIPCGWVNKDAELIIGRGGLINLEILKQELREVRVAMPNIADRLAIDAKCGVLEPRHHESEGGTHGEIHGRIGSTGEGVGAARYDRMARKPDGFKFAADFSREELLPGLPLSRLIMDNTPGLLQRRRLEGRDILIEGTQGSGLSLIHGHWPYVTSTDTNAAQMAADCGIPPQHITDVMLVLRTYPIRVAGNSGPLRDEISWAELSKRIGREVCEKTTVTKKIRRVGCWDEDMVAAAVTLNAPTMFALTFMDYMFPSDVGKRDFDQLSDQAKQWVNYIEKRFCAPVVLIGTGWSDDAGWACVNRWGTK